MFKRFPLYLGIIFLPVFVSAESTVTLDRVVASIDGEPVTKSEVDRYAKTSGNLNPEQKKSGEAEVLKELLLERLLLKEAELLRVSVNDEEIEAYVEEIQKQNKVNRAGFKKLLRRRGLNDKTYRTQVRDDILRTRVISTAVRSKVNIVDEDVRRFFDEHPERKPEEGAVHVYQILLPLKEGSAKKVEGRIKEIRERLLAGELWQQIGGGSFSDLGYIKPGDLREKMKIVVESLSVGEISDVVQLEGGVAVLGVVGIQGESEDVSETLKQQIKREIFEERFNVLVESYLNEELPRKYRLEIFL